MPRTPGRKLHEQTLYVARLPCTLPGWPTSRSSDRPSVRIPAGRNYATEFFPRRPRKRKRNAHRNRTPPLVRLCRPTRTRIRTTYTQYTYVRTYVRARLQIAEIEITPTDIPSASRYVAGPNPAHGPLVPRIDANIPSDNSVAYPDRGTDIRYPGVITSEISRARHKIAYGDRLAQRLYVNDGALARSLACSRRSNFFVLFLRDAPALSPTRLG